MKFAYYFALLLYFAVSSCSKIPKEKTALLDLFQQEKSLNCQLASMKDSITVEWNNINLLLEDSIPTDMPEEEKNNMLKVRNANLIRMFQSFDNLDERVKMALNKTEQLDMEMTKRITAIKREFQQIESQKMKFLEKINRREGANEVARLKEIHQSILSENCQ